MKKIVITGAFGNLGLMCVEQALAQGYRLRCFDVDNAATRKLAARYHHKAEIVLGDIRDNTLLEKLVEGVDAIIHNVSLLPPLTDTHPELAYAINVTACKQLIAVAEQQPGKPLLVFPSSFTVFGAQSEKGRIYTAADPVTASDHYTAHKIEIEQHLHNSSLPWVIVRIGVSVDARTLKTDRSTFKKLLSVKADNPLEYVHPKDVALAMCNAVSRPQAVGKVLLLGGGKRCQIDQHTFLAIAFKAFGLTLPLSVHGNQDYYTRWLDTTESQQILHFQKHDMADYQREMMQRLRYVRWLVKPFAPLINPLLPWLLKKL